MYYDLPVAIPTVKGKIITKRKGGSTYVLFQYGQDYKPDRKYAIPQRAIIGKVNPDDTSRMFPNEKYEIYFPDAAIPEELPEAYRSCALKIGSYVVIKKVFDDYGLPDMLRKRFGGDTGLLMDLVSYLIVEEENVGQYYPDFAFEHPLFSEKMRIYSDSKISRFLKSVTKEQITGFLDDWNKKRDHKQCIYISYDSTNKNGQAGDIDLLEYGKAKDNKGFPIFNLAVAYDENNRVPLFYETYGGSINDVAQFTCMVDKVIDYGYKKVGFILDRGYFSKENIRYLEANQFPFIMMVKGCKQLVSSIIMENRNSFETDRDCIIRAYRVYGKTVHSRLYEDDTRDRYFHIYFNPGRQAAEREQLEKHIDKMKLFLDKHAGQKTTFGSMYQDYFNLQYNKKGVFTGYSEKKDFISRKLELCGYFCIITSNEMTAAQALIHYKGRDVSEKLFSTDKSFIGSKSMRVQSEEALSAKLFIEFVALVVRNRIYNLLKELMLRIEVKANYLTVPAALRELEKIEMGRRNKGQYKLDHAVSKKQKQILSAFGMNEKSIDKAAGEIGKILANSQSLPDIENETKEEEDYDGEDALYDFD